MKSLHMFELKTITISQIWDLTMTRVGIISSGPGDCRSWFDHSFQDFPGLCARQEWLLAEYRIHVAVNGVIDPAFFSQLRGYLDICFIKAVPNIFCPATYSSDSSIQVLIIWCTNVLLFTEPEAYTDDIPPLQEGTHVVRIVYDVRTEWQRTTDVTSDVFTLSLWPSLYFDVCPHGRCCV